MSHAGRCRWARRTAVPAVVALLAPAACQRSAALPASAPVVDIAMGEYHFAYDEPVPAGRVVFRARNTGRLPHEIIMVTLPPEFRQSIREQLRGDTRRAFPTKAQVPTRLPGATGTFAVDLVPGRYALICFVNDPDGVTHARKGMSSEFRVS